MSFNWLLYKELNPDLTSAGLKTKSDFERHFVVHGKGENRKYSIQQLYPDFNSDLYRERYEDLRSLDKNGLELHWLMYGRKENRCYIDRNVLKLINGIDIIYWINLDSSFDRKVHMSNILEHVGVKNERISAIDGRNIYNVKDYFIEKYPAINKTTNLEYACLLSHLNTIKKFNESSNNICLILEDDISLEFSTYWKKDINTIIKEAPLGWDIIMISSTIENQNYVSQMYNKWNSEIYSTLSYIINKNGSNKIMKQLYDHKSNKWILKDKIHTADFIIYNNCNTYLYKYCYFTVNNLFNSTIHSSHIDNHMKSKLFAKNIWLA